MANSGEIKRYRRYKGWDYAKGASLFITIATAPRRALFGVVRDGVVVLSALGEKVKEALEAIPLLNPGILLFGYVQLRPLAGACRAAEGAWQCNQAVQELYH